MIQISEAQAIAQAGGRGGIRAIAQSAATGLPLEYYLSTPDANGNLIPYAQWAATQGGGGSGFSFPVVLVLGLVLWLAFSLFD